MAPSPAMASFRALYFGRHLGTGGALFGWLHAPAPDSDKRCAIVICPPLGYEGICAVPAMRQLAERLASSGYPVLRLDVHGTGDSGGDDADPDRVRAWLDSIHDAVDEVRAQTGLVEVCLVGVRIGATLAAKAAAERGDLQRVVLWAPCVSGKRYLREMKAFRMLAEQSGEMSFKPRAEGDTSQESGGFLLTGDTVAALKSIDLVKKAERVADQVLVIDRDDQPVGDKLGEALTEAGAETATQTLAGYAEMMVAPDRSVFPESVFHAILGWMSATAVPEREVTVGEPQGKDHGLVAEGVREEVVRFGRDDAMVGVLTRPVEASSEGRPLIVFSNTAGNYRIGPSRMYVELARKWAAEGWSTFRLDVSGVGDSVIHDDPALNHPYADGLLEDVGAAMGRLKERGDADTFVVAGLCSGAFVAYHVAQREPSVVGIILINLQIFAWEEGMSLEVSPLQARERTKHYRSRIFEPEVWRKALRGGVDLGSFATFVQARAVDGARSAVAKVKARLPESVAPASEQARVFTSLLDRGADVFLVFATEDPGIDNLNDKLGPALASLQRRSGFEIVKIEGPDHSFTPLWAQGELEEVLSAHLRSSLTAP